MNELVRITNNVIGDKNVNSVDARELWKALESKQDFSNWFKNKVVDNIFFTENVDYIMLNNVIERATTGASAGGSNRKEYALTTRAGKKVAMEEHTTVGDKVRDYFLECEEIALAGGTKITPQIKDLKYLTPEFKASLELASLFGFKGNQALLSANKAVRNMHGEDCMALLGSPALVSPSQIQYYTPTLLGKKIGLSAMKLNALMQAVGLQVAERDYKNKIVWNISSLGKQHSQLCDTGKKHGDGSPVQQIKWAESVLDLCEAYSREEAVLA